MSKVAMCISYYDLNHFLKKEWLEVDDLEKQQLDEILSYLGMDINTYEVEEVLHRPVYSINNEPWYGKRFIGYERQDKDWMFSKKSSIENIIASQTDVEHAAELIRMSQQANNTAYVSERMERFKPENPEVVI